MDYCLTKLSENSFKFSAPIFASVFALNFSGASAATFQVTSTFDVIQDIAVGWDPSFYQDNQGYGDPIDEGYVLYDEYVRILNEEAGIWDPSQISANPATATTNVSSTGQLTGTWTFNASFLDEIDAFASEDDVSFPQFLGQSSDVSIFEVNFNGTQIGTGITSQSSVFALNNAIVGEGGEQLDIVAVNAIFEDGPGEESEGAALYMGFESDWFERFSVGEFDTFEEFFSGVSVTTVEYYESQRYLEDGILPTGVSYQAGDLQYDTAIFAEIGAPNLSFQGFGDADGSSEDEPLLPVTVSQIDDDSAPTFSFDVSGAGVGDIVFIDPEIAVGYVYELEGDGVITAFVAPSTDAVAVPSGFAGYQVTVVGGNLDGQVFTIMPTDPSDVMLNALNFAETDGVRSLILEGIWVDNGINPTDFQTFVAGFGLLGTTANTQINQTALTQFVPDPSPVPLPAGGVLMISGLGGLLLTRKRRKQTRN